MCSTYVLHVDVAALDPNFPSNHFASRSRKNVIGRIITPP